MVSQQGTRIRLLLVDTSSEADGGSMSRYMRLVQSALAGLPGFDKRFVVSTLRLALPCGTRNVFPAKIGTWINHAWLMISGVAAIRRQSPDIVHLLDGSHAYLLHPPPDAHAVATVHDLIPLLQQRQVFGADPTSFMSRWLVRRCLTALRGCSLLISVSGNTRRDLQTLVGIGSATVEVVPNALDPEYLDIATGATPEQKVTSGDSAGIVLHVGNNGLYKNREGLLRIFARISQSSDARLKLVGPPPAPSLLRRIEELGLRERVEFVVNAGDQQLRELYRSASLLLFPSLYEGFGWPPLEAMACGCPVVCSSEASLPEVVGQAALTAPASDEEQLARHCLHVLQNTDIAAELRTKGRAHVLQFTVKRMGEQLLAVYERVLDEKAEPKTRSEAARLGA